MSESEARIDWEAKCRRLREAARPIYRWAHDEHAHARLGDPEHDPDCLLCDQIDRLYGELYR